MLCIGHRGARGHAPENTLASVRKAIALGADWIEIDVYWVDGELVVFHDDHLERLTNGQGLVLDQRFDYLRSLDAGEGEQIPTLAEVFEVAAGQVGINVELKGPGTAEPVVRFLQNWQGQDGQGQEGQTQLGADLSRVLLSSFRQDELRRVHQLNPVLQIGVLFVELPQGSMDAAIVQAQASGAWSLHLAKEAVTAAVVAAAHAAGLRVLVFTVNEVADMERLRSLGVDGVFTDYPDLLVGLRT